VRKRRPKKKKKEEKFRQKSLDTLGRLMVVQKEVAAYAFLLFGSFFSFHLCLPLPVVALALISCIYYLGKSVQGVLPGPVIYFSSVDWIWVLFQS